LVGSFSSFGFLGWFFDLLVFLVAFFGTSFLFQVGLVIRAFSAIIHEEESVLVKILKLLIVSLGIFGVLVLVDSFFISREVVPDISTLFHGFRMGALLLRLDLVDVCSSKE